ncbi:MAG: DUF3280 domain-containing protein [Pseudomonadota bacterium]
MRLPAIAAATLCATLLSLPAVGRAEPAKAAFFGVLFINTSQSETSAEEEARLAALEARLIEKLEASGRYLMVDTAPVAAKINLYANPADCNGCDSDLARELGADVAITGEVQKTSDLILGLSIYIRDAGTGALVAGGSADMRGNTDLIWQRTLDWVLRNRVLKP